MSYPQLLADTSASVAAASQTSDPISFQTALLVIIAGALLFLAKNLAKLNNRLATVEAVSRAPFAPREASGAGVVEPEVVAAISAAIHTTLGARHRIISVGEIYPNRLAWSAEGRRQVFGSHKVR